MRCIYTPGKTNATFTSLLLSRHSRFGSGRQKMQDLLQNAKYHCFPILFLFGASLSLSPSEYVGFKTIFQLQFRSTKLSVHVLLNPSLAQTPRQFFTDTHVLSFSLPHPCGPCLVLVYILKMFLLLIWSYTCFNLQFECCTFNGYNDMQYVNRFRCAFNANCRYMNYNFRRWS